MNKILSFRVSPIVSPFYLHRNASGQSWEPNPSICYLELHNARKPYSADQKLVLWDIAKSLLGRCLSHPPFMWLYIANLWVSCYCCYFYSHCSGWGCTEGWPRCLPVLCPCCVPNAPLPCISQLYEPIHFPFA